ncbi:MAG: hypothetical protein M3680_28770 [Myxococcota bacterium]|nr:hypothetical protein [Myxococcota bacterium]
MDQDEYDDQVRLRKSHRARWVATIGGTLLVLGWGYRKMTEYRLEQAQQESLELSYALSQQRYDLADYRPAPTSAVEPVVTTNAPEVTERLVAFDRAWRPAIRAFDPASVPATAPPCAPLAAAYRETPSWIVAVAAPLGLPDGTVITSPVPVTVIGEGEELPAHSPEASVRISAIAARAASGTTIPESAADPLRTVDVLLVFGAAPPGYAAKAAKAAKVAAKAATKAATTSTPAAEPRAEGSASGAATIATHVARAWVFDHRGARVVCAGLVPLPPVPAGEPTQLDEDRLRDLLGRLPDAVRSVP